MNIQPANYQNVQKPHFWQKSSGSQWVNSYCYLMAYIPSSFHFCCVFVTQNANHADCRPCRPCRLQTEDFFLTIDSRFSVLVTKYIVTLWVFSLSLSLLSVTAKTLRETNSLFVRSRSNCLNCQATQATADMTVLVLQMRPLHLSSDNTKEEK